MQALNSKEFEKQPKDHHRVIISSISLVFFFFIKLFGWMKHWIIFTGGSILEACESDDNRTQKQKTVWCTGLVIFLGV